MPTFDTPQPISVQLSFDAGTAHITASQRSDTVVDVQPRNHANNKDVRSAQQTTVSYAEGILVVKGERKLFGKTGHIDITIELPAGSMVNGNSALGGFTCAGQLGECTISTALGDIRVEAASRAQLKTQLGDIHLRASTGDASVTGGGHINVGTVDGTATIKNINGETTIGQVNGELKAKSSNGRIIINAARANVDAKSANGTIRIGEVKSGTVILQTARGDLEIGIPKSTAAWLDVNTRVGAIRNELSATQGPAATEETVEVRARTTVGNIIIRRALPADDNATVSDHD